MKLRKNKEKWLKFTKIETIKDPRTKLEKAPNLGTFKKMKFSLTSKCCHFKLKKYINATESLYFF
jgi:hypothetical protein